MALIKCKECKQSISDKASSCPHCGAPVKLDEVYNEKETEIVTVKVSKFVIMMYCVFVNACGGYVSFFLSVGGVKGVYLFIPLFITVLVSLGYIYNSTHTYITLTNRRVVGKYTKLIRSIDIDCPLRQIKNVRTFNILGISHIRVSTGREWFQMWFATNVKEFKRKYFDLIENKYKYI